jgi:hypothetical protein
MLLGCLKDDLTGTLAVGGLLGFAGFCLGTAIL